MRYYTPLRYPGGKASLGHYMRQIFVDSGLLGGGYVEPYAGGAAIGLELLMTGYVRDIWLNDSDPAIHSFWCAALDHTEEMVKLILSTPLTIEEWRRQRSILVESCPDDHLKLGFAALFLNRTNRSGILKGGVIGGLAQNGRWLIDARFNREAIVERLKRISQYKTHIHVSGLDAEQFLQNLSIPKKSLIYMDPPYFKNGQRLYRNHYRPDDHKRIAELVQSELRTPWIVSYDNHTEIAELYSKRRQIEYSLRYSAQTKRQGDELLIFSDGVTFPDTEYPGAFRVN